MVKVGWKSMQIEAHRGQELGEMNPPQTSSLLDSAKQPAQEKETTMSDFHES